MLLVVSGFVPSPLGEIHEYVPNFLELRVASGIFGVGLLLFTVLCKVAVSIEAGRLTRSPPRTELANQPHWLVSRLFHHAHQLQRDVRLVLGSEEGVDVRILSDRVSRKHAEIRWDGTCFVVLDLGSTNGTTLNGHQVVGVPCPLFDGDVLALGGHELFVSVPPAGEEPVSPAETRRYRIEPNRPTE